MTDADRHLPNLVGAWSRRVNDVATEAVRKALGQSDSTSAALVSLVTFPEGSLNQLRQALGLTHSGVVRVVDKLVAEGWAERRSRTLDGEDGRAVHVTVTARGREAAQRLLDQHQAALDEILAPLDGHERQMLAAMLHKMLEHNAQSQAELLRTCRLCELEICDPCPLLGRLATR